MYVCICKGITDKQIKEEIKAGAESLEDLQSTLGVASCCGSCADLACSFLEQEERAPILLKTLPIDKGAESYPALVR